MNRAASVLGIVVVLTLTSIGHSHAAFRVNGYVFLDGQADHSGVKVALRASSPGAISDSTTTDSAGGFEVSSVALGVYNVEYSKTGYETRTLWSYMIESDTTLVTVTLLPTMTPISGGLSGVLSLGRSPYKVTDDIEIGRDDTLLIEAGVRLYFAGQYDLDVRGQLVAEGTAEEPILFTTYNLPSVPNSWGTIWFLWPTGTESRLVHCSVEFGKDGLWAYETHLVIASCTITGMGGGGIRYDDCPTGLCINNVIANNGFGIACYSSSPSIIANTIVHNGPKYQSNGGIKMQGDSAPLVANNTIVANSYGGVIFETSASLAQVVSNVIVANWSGIACYQTPFAPSATPTIKNNDLWENNANWQSEIRNFDRCPAPVGDMRFKDDWGTSCDIYGNISQDPVFIQSEAKDYRLQESSPCIDAGDPDNPGGIAFHGAAPDIGAYESLFLRPGVPLDINGEEIKGLFGEDSSVGLDDFLLLVGVFGKKSGDDGFDGKYDLDRDGNIGLGDFLVFVSNFGKVAVNWP